MAEDCTALRYTAESETDDKYAVRCVGANRSDAGTIFPHERDVNTSPADHSLLSVLGDADVNLKKIARLMGPSNTKQTERYVHPTDDGLLAATEYAAQGGRTTIVPQRLKEAG